MNWIGGGLIMIINTASMGAATSIQGAILTENNLPILTENSDTLTVENP